MKHKITLDTLSSGLKAIHIHYPGSSAAYCGIAIKAGSRNEDSHEHGLAHFVEHNIFKGTDHRRAAHIIKRMESVGGELNAYTTKEETVIYSVFPSGNLARAAELIGDLAAHSRFPISELNKERDVVADEIDSYLDSPSEAIFDDFEDHIFAGSSLGHNILGDIKSLRTFNSDSCLDFVHRNYRADNIVAFYCGGQSATSAFATLDKYFSVISNSNAGKPNNFTTPKLLKPFDITKSISSHQAHCIIGARVPGYLNDARIPTALLANILGGPGMNSLLNVELREKRGLVYTVEASTSLFSDCGLLTIYFGCDHDDLNKCRELIDKTIKRLPDTITTSRLEAAKKQYLGQLTVASENRESHLLAAARSTLWRGEPIADATVAQAIKDITLSDLHTAILPLYTPSTLTFTSKQN